VGQYTDSNQTRHPLIEHWDGSQWRIVKSPKVSSQDTYLAGVTALSSKDVWAVGEYFKSFRGPAFALTEHWDGSQWRIISNAGGKATGLTASTSLDARHVWAVGGNGNSALTERWNGSRWRLVPNPGNRLDVLYAVAASSVENLWAVGIAYGPLTFTEHWNGKTWQVVPSPNVPNKQNWLAGVAMTSAHTVWAVGYFYNPENTLPYNTLIEYYC
jgi:hypothetical protein